VRVVPDLAVIEKYGSYRALDIRDAPGNWHMVARVIFLIKGFLF
jgi:hypothetical protein